MSLTDGERHEELLFAMIGFVEEGEPFQGPCSSVPHGYDLGRPLGPTGFVLCAVHDMMIVSRFNVLVGPLFDTGRNVLPGLRVRTPRIGTPEGMRGRFAPLRVSPGILPTLSGSTPWTRRWARRISRTVSSRTFLRSCVLVSDSTGFRRTTVCSSSTQSFAQGRLSASAPAPAVGLLRRAIKCLLVERTVQAASARDARR